MKPELDDSGCRRLWAAVLWQAIKDADYSEGRGAAYNWIFSNRSDVGSMRWICDMLDLDYDKLQTLSMSRAGRSKILGREDGSSRPRYMPRQRPPAIKPPSPVDPLSQQVELL